MKLQGYRDAFYTFSGKLSDICRQLAFAGIGLIWLFKKDNPTGLSIPRELFVPGALVVGALVFDLLQYAFGSILWRSFYQRKEKEKVGEDVEIDHSDSWEIPIWIAFCLKTICIAIAYGYLLAFFICNIEPR